MPNLIIYDANNLDALRADGQDEYIARKIQIERAYDYYAGEMKKWLVDPKTKNELPENVTINLAQKIIDQSVSMLMGESPEIDAHDDAANAALEAVIDRSLDDIFFHTLAASGAISGHMFVKIVPSANGVRWVLIDPSIVQAFWLPDDSRRPIAYKIQWNSGKTEYRQDIALVDGAWVVRDMTRRSYDGAWELTAETAWPYPFPPIVDGQNLPDYQSYYGRSDLTGLEINDAVNFVASNVNLILKHHAHPKTIGTGVKSEQVKETAVAGFWAIENDAARVFNLEMQSDLSSSMAYLQFLRNEFFSQQRAVDIQSVKDKVGALTNFGLRVFFSDAIQKNNTKKLLYGYIIKELAYRTLLLMGYSVNAQDIDVRFSDPMPVNDLENASRIKTELESGIISRETAAKELGYEWADETLRMTAEKSSQGASVGQALLDAMRKMDATNPASENA